MKKKVGRKPTNKPALIHAGVYLEPELYDFFRSKGGSKWARAILKKQFLIHKTFNDVNKGNENEN